MLQTGESYREEKRKRCYYMNGLDVEEEDLVYCENGTRMRGLSLLGASVLSLTHDSQKWK